MLWIIFTTFMSIVGIAGVLMVKGSQPLARSRLVTSLGMVVAGACMSVTAIWWFLNGLALRALATHPGGPAGTFIMDSEDAGEALFARGVFAGLVGLGLLFGAYRLARPPKGTEGNSQPSKLQPK